MILLFAFYYLRSTALADMARVQEQEKREREATLSYKKQKRVNLQMAG